MAKRAFRSAAWVGLLMAWPAASQGDRVRIGYAQEGADLNEWGFTSGLITVRAEIDNAGSASDSLRQLRLDLLQAGRVAATASSPVGAIPQGGQGSLTAALTVPDAFRDYRLRITLARPGDPGKDATWLMPTQENLNGIYQWFLRDGEDPGKPLAGAYLWIPPKTRILKGFLFSCKNMLERRVLEAPEIRKLAAELDLGIVLLNMIGPTYGTQLLDGLHYDYTQPGKAAKLKEILQGLATISGHPELVNAPYLPLGHSAYIDFAWDMAYADPARTLGVIPIKSGFGTRPAFDPDRKLPDVPVLFFMGGGPGGEFASVWRGVNYEATSSRQFGGFPGYYRTPYRPGSASAGELLAGMLFDRDGGHMDMTPMDIHLLALFIRKACGARLPSPWAAAPDGRTLLRPVPLESGWLVDKNIQSGGHPFPTAAYAAYQGPKNEAHWYLDEELARACESQAKEGYGREIQMFTFRNRGVPDPLTEEGFVTLDASALRDDTLDLEPVFFGAPPRICQAPWSTLVNGVQVTHDKDPNAVHPLRAMPGVPEVLRHSGETIRFAPKQLFEQTGSHTFVVKFDRWFWNAAGYADGGVLGYVEGADGFTRATRYATLSLPPRTQASLKPQTVEFPDPPALETIPSALVLHARATSGLPVEYFVAAGPGYMEDSVLRIAQFPAQARSPVTWIVGAYQRGKPAPGGWQASPTVLKTIRLDPALALRPGIPASAGARSRGSFLVDAQGRHAGDPGNTRRDRAPGLSIHSRSAALFQTRAAGTIGTSP